MKKNILIRAVEQFSFLIVDLKRWSWSSIKDCFYNCFEPGVWVTIIYRTSRSMYLIKIPVISIFFRLIAFFLFKFSELFLSVALRPVTEIGPGLYIGHTGVIRIHPDTKAGRNLSIGQLVTIGTKGVGNRGVPAIGDNVYIGVGAKVLGNIKIGNNVKIGANAVVISDIPDNATAVGVPAKIVKTDNRT